MSWPAEQVRPGAKLDFAIDWKTPPAGRRDGYLGAGVTISAVTWTLPPGLSADNAPAGAIEGSGTISRIQNVTGFVDGTDYELVCEIIYGAQLNKDSRVITIDCRA